MTQLVGYDKEFKELLNITVRESPIVLYGHTGCGKTRIVEDVIKERNVKYISYEHGIPKKQMINRIETFVKYSNDEAWIIIDEVESMISNIKSIVNDCKEIIKKAVFIFICNINYRNRLEAIYKFYEIELKILDKMTIHKICKHIRRNKKDIKSIIELLYPDIRKIINSLSNKLDIHDVQFHGVKQNLEYILTNKKEKRMEDLLKYSMYDIFLGIPMIYENYISQGNKQLIKISELLCTADIYHSKIYKNQQWDSLKIIGFIGIMYPIMLFNKKMLLKNVTVLSKINNLHSKQNRIKNAMVIRNVTTYPQLLVLNYAQKDNLCKTFNVF
tara:strand:- start:300 stop:1286 length:987 start_codon:yes stop_codon:yes gene_type:complete